MAVQHVCKKSGQPMGSRENAHSATSPFRKTLNIVFIIFQNNNNNNNNNKGLTFVSSSSDDVRNVNSLIKV